MRSKPGLMTLAWIALVAGCALPLALEAVPTASAEGRMAMLAGSVAWIVAIVVLDRRSWRETSAASHLMAGATLVMLGQGLLALLLPSPGLALLYFPAVRLATSLPLIPSDASDFAGYLVLTLMCGAQVAAVSFLAGHGVARLRARRSPRHAV